MAGSKDPGGSTSKSKDSAPAGVSGDGTKRKTDSKKFVKLGIQAYKAGNIKLAAGYFTKARTLDPKNNIARRYEKMAREKLGN